MIDADALRQKLANLERQRSQLAAASKELDGAINFCKGLLKEAEDAAKAPEPPATTEPQG